MNFWLLFVIVLGYGKIQTFLLEQMEKIHSLAIRKNMMQTTFHLIYILLV